AVFILSISTICAKFAAGQEFMSFGFIAFYGGVILALGLYALIWQQVLKKIPLTNAFVNKSASLIWSLIWGVTLFGEIVSINMLIGIIIVFIGVILVVTGNSRATKPELEKEATNE
ncbi:transporter, partial [Candidatus Saccharibacteria bacterium]|nr:transporter [Candidatus Saccharibacteria bacterium]